MAADAPTHPTGAGGAAGARPPPLRERLRAALGLLPHVGRTFRILWQTSSLLTLAITALTFASALIPAALAWVAKLIVDSVVAAVAAGAAGGGAARTLRLVA